MVNLGVINLNASQQAHAILFMSFPSQLLLHTPKLVRNLFPDVIWHRSRNERKIYLTFDDGPSPGITRDVAGILNEYEAKAAFFCLGKNVLLYPEIVNEISGKGHEIGNHGYSHRDPWVLPGEETSGEFHKTRELIEYSAGIRTELYRAPFGHLTPSMLRMVSGYSRIVMWDLMPGEFLEGRSAANCLERIKRNINSGSIVVLHDNAKCAAKLRAFLPQAMAFIRSEGYEFGIISGF